MTRTGSKTTLSFSPPKMDRESAWLLTYISLFTSLLAFFSSITKPRHAGTK